MPVTVVMMWYHIIMGSVVGVVNCWNEGEEPCGDSEYIWCQKMLAGAIPQVVWMTGND